jgi:hypothetical protein
MVSGSGGAAPQVNGFSIRTPREHVGVDEDLARHRCGRPGRSCSSSRVQDAPPESPVGSSRSSSSHAVSPRPTSRARRSRISAFREVRRALAYSRDAFSSSASMARVTFRISTGYVGPPSRSTRGNTRELVDLGSARRFGARLVTRLVTSGSTCRFVARLGTRRNDESPGTPRLSGMGDAGFEPATSTV